MRVKRSSSAAIRPISLAQLRWAAMFTAVAVLPGAALAAPASKTPPSKTSAKKKLELPETEAVVRQTGDGLKLHLTYYPGPAKRPDVPGKRTVPIPIVMLHMWKQSRSDYKDLATFLQSQGHAVIVPDLRGHGESTRLKGDRRDETLKAATMSPQQFKLMVAEDMKAVKEFLWERNNDGELNIDKLCVVGAEMGSAVALNFAMVDAVDQDHNRVFGADREFKRGRFVKAMVLISPEPSFRGLPTRLATAYPAVQNDISLLIVVGKQDTKALDDAKRINTLFEKYHPEPTGDDKTDKQTLFFLELDTKLQGTKLLDPKLHIPILLYSKAEGLTPLNRTITLQAVIADFIERRLIKSEQSKEWTWQERRSPRG
jgi:pimeloyl-ACP methyl ester carboxylesterase